MLTHYYLYKSESLRLIDYQVYDFIQEFINKEDSSSGSHVVIVDIDEKSIASLGQWPWPRIMTAQLLKKINQYNPGAIGFDIVFPEKDRTSPSEIITFYQNFFNIKTTVSGLDEKLQNNDILFANEIKKSRSVLSHYMSQNNVETPEECFSGKEVDFLLGDLEPMQAKSILCNTLLLQKFHIASWVY